MLDNSKKNIRKEACWTLSNVTAGTAEQIQSVINACVFPKLIQLLGSSEFDIQVSSCRCVAEKIYSSLFIFFLSRSFLSTSPSPFIPA
jgi:hypothetical protein